MLRIEMIIDARAALGEGPLWDVEEQRLYWIDSLGPAVHVCDPKGGIRKSWPLPEPIGSIALRKEGGGAVLALKSGFHFLDFKTGQVSRIVEPDPGKPRIRMNDGKVDRRGRFVAGYMDTEERDPLCARRLGRSDGRIAGGIDHEPQLWGPEPRHRLRHLHGPANRWRGAEGEGGRRALRGLRPRRCGRA